MVVSGQQSSTISVYAIEANGGLKLLQKYPTSKDTNWVEIVDIE
jgi:6-phosphogluconolactonase (cycloisomerase 2 family)